MWTKYTKYCNYQVGRASAMWRRLPLGQSVCREYEKHVDRVLLLHGYHDERTFIEVLGRPLRIVDKLLKMNSMRTTVTIWNEFYERYFNSDQEMRTILVDHLEHSDRIGLPVVIQLA